MRTWMALVACGLLGMACGEEDDDPFTTPATSGRDNGMSCFFSGAGSRNCGGGTCLGVFGVDIGVCSESCTASCRRGGLCGAIPNGDRVCMVPCAIDADCKDELVTCQDAFEGLLLCPEALRCEPVSELQRFCLPLVPPELLGQ